MKNKANKEMILQVGILSICFIIMAFNHLRIPIKAQTLCSGPKFFDATHPQRFAWRQNALISVKIYTTSDANDFKALDEGIRKWNDHNHIFATCSNVTIDRDTVGVSPIPSGYPPVPSGIPPENEIWVVRDYGTENPHGDIITHKGYNPNGPGSWVQGATIFISPDITNNTPKLFLLSRYS